MENKLLFLGTGGSMGVPQIACDCVVCSSSNDKNKRLRSSVLFEVGGKRFLIDASPDFRNVALKYKIDRFDVLFISHYHDDHTMGLSEMRIYFLKENKKIPLVLSKVSYEEIASRFGYLLNRFEVMILPAERGEIVVEGQRVRYFTYWQEGTPVTGFRFGNTAYLTDIKKYDEKTIFKDLAGIKTLVVSTIHKKGSRMHFSLSEAALFAEHAGMDQPGCKTYITHISHQMEHEETAKELPLQMELAYDGLEIYVE